MYDSYKMCWMQTLPSLDIRVNTLDNWMMDVHQVDIMACLALTYWGPMTHLSVSKLNIRGTQESARTHMTNVSSYSWFIIDQLYFFLQYCYILLPGRHQAIIRINARILLIEPLGTHLSEILVAIYTFSFKKINLKMSPAKWRRFCIGLIVLNTRLHYLS